MDAEAGNAFAAAPLLDPTMASASGSTATSMPANIPASELMAAAVSSTYLLSSMSQGMNMPVMNLQPARMNQPPMQPTPSGRSLSDFMLAPNTLLHPLVTQVPQLINPNQFALMQDHPECVCINQAPNQAMVAASVRQQNPMSAGHSSTASGSTSNRMRKRPREEGSSSAIKRQRTNAGFTEQTRNSSAARAIQLQQISALTSSLSRNESFNLSASRSISNPNLPQQSSNPPPSTVPVCASCRRVPVPNDEAGGSHQPPHPCNCQVFHTCNNGCLLNQPQFFRPNPIPPPPPTQPMMMYERPGSSAHRVRDGEQPQFPCVPTAMSQMDSTMFGLISSQLNHISAQQRLQRMVPQSQLTVPPFFNRNYINAPRNTSNFNLGLAATALHPEQVNLLNTRQQQNVDRNEQMNNFYRQHNPQRLVQVQTQTTSEILRNQTLQNNPMIIVPGFNPGNNGIEMISFLMNGHDGALYVPHAEATAHVAHAMNHEPQPIGASSECIKQCTTIKSYIKDPEVPEQETERCTVCLLDFETGDEIRTLHCNHIYHIDCIDRWLQYNKKCPVCRLDMDKAPIVIDDTEEEQAANAIGITAQ